METPPVLEPEALATARRLMGDFAARTGLAPGSDAPKRRYLWTDAFAVCNFLELHRLTGEEEQLQLALRLVEEVHEVLGRHRPDDARRGWISGLSEDEGREHPTVGGLRIGKRGKERGPDEPFDERLEWERDGQYYHYLTKWMHALARVAEVTGERRHLAQAVELALAAARGFTRLAPDGSKRLVWKASIDLSRALVPSSGHHDPLDGLLTLRGLRAVARDAGLGRSAAALEVPLAELAAMVEGADQATLDPLGLGGLLADLLRLARLAAREGAADLPLLTALAHASARGLAGLARARVLAGSPAERLAFRELGLAIGLAAVPRLERLLAREPALEAARGVLAPDLEILRAFPPLGAALVGLWLEPSSRRTALWREHEDIDDVMLATSLVPDGFLAS